MPLTELKRLNRHMARLVLVAMCINLLVVAYVFAQSYEGRVELIKSQRAGCDRGKMDRRDTADFQLAQKSYLLKVTRAKSVREDVKQAARTASTTFERTSAGLLARSMIDCKKAYKDATILP